MSENLRALFLPNAELNVSYPLPNTGARQEWNPDGCPILHRECQMELGRRLEPHLAVLHYLNSYLE